MIKLAFIGLLSSLCLLHGGQIEMPATLTRFEAVDIYLDSAGEQLAAYQIEFAGSKGVTIAGIEGGAHPAFAQPPFYDPKAIRHERVIIAAFSNAADLPKGKTRVATIHVQVRGQVEPGYKIRLKTAGNAKAQKITAQPSFEKRNSQ